MKALLKVFMEIAKECLNWHRQYRKDYCDSPTRIERERTIEGFIKKRIPELADILAQEDSWDNPYEETAQDSL